MKGYRSACACLLGLLLAVAYRGHAAQGSPRAKAADQARGGEAELRDDSDGSDWPAYGRTYGEQHYSPLRQIDVHTVPRLGLAWAMDLGPGNPATIPIAVDGVLYFASGLSVVRAVDAVTGTLRWSYDPQVGAAGGLGVRQGWGSRGIGYWHGKVYVGTADGRLIAIHADTGTVAWSVSTVAKDEGRYITGAPRVFDGKVIVGHGGNDSASIRGYVTCYDAETGRERWRFYTVPGNPADGFEDDAQRLAAQTWSGPWWTYGGGGSVWNSVTYDPATRTVFVGTGNGSPWNRKVRSADRGDNLFVASIVALDADTGRYKWHYQLNPGETWDYDASLDMQLADLRIAGTPRKVLIQAAKNGFLYVLDRTTGELISAEKFAKVTWATRIDPANGRPLEVPGARFPHGEDFELWPSLFGAHSWHPSAYSPRAHLLFVPVIEKGVIYNDRGITADTWRRWPGNAADAAVNLDLASVDDPLNNTSWLLAIDPATQRQVWRIRTPAGADGGLLATGGDLVFQGDTTGSFNAYDARSGEKRWTFETRAGIVAAPITYLAHGTQYVALAVGIGTGAALAAASPVSADYRTQPKRLLTFAIDLHATLPTPAVAASARLRAPDDAGYRADAGLAQTGAIDFGRHCANCHGMGAVSVGNAPDLRASSLPLAGEAFARVVRGGALSSNGMPRFAEFDDATLDAIRQYLRAQAALLRTAQ
jgi:quinohemoprotein ethanol dehydrogenase